MDYPFAVVEKPRSISKSVIITTLSKMVDLYAEGEIDRFTINANTVSLHMKLFMDTDQDMLDSYESIFQKINHIRNLCGLSLLPIHESQSFTPIEREICMGDKYETNVSADN